MAIVYLLLLGLMFLFLLTGLEVLYDDIQQLALEIDLLKSTLYDMEDKLNSIREELESWSVYEATAYAPLDSAAKEGMCYRGDPSITASGAKVVPGITVAAGPDIPFGTEIYIRGLGRRVVQDRGGRITNRSLDIAVSTQEEALRFGRRHVLAKVAIKGVDGGH